MAPSLRRLVRERAQHTCEYCHLSQTESGLSFHVEHIIPRQHGGATTEENLALSCPNCNLHKGPNLTGIDPDSGLVCLLFHPRQDIWAEHFRMDPDFKIFGLTPTGRTTIWVMQMNDSGQIAMRQP